MIHPLEEVKEVRGAIVGTLPTQAKPGMGPYDIGQELKLERMATVCRLAIGQSPKKKPTESVIR